MRPHPHAILSMLVFTSLLSWAVTCSAQLPASDPGNTGNWVFNPAFSDEFNGTSLDASKWDNVTNWSGRYPSLFLASNVTVGADPAVPGSSCLQITQRRDVNNITIPPDKQREGFKGYTSGIAQTWG